MSGGGLSGDNVATPGILGWLAAGSALAFGRRACRTVSRGLERRHRRRLELARARQVTYRITPDGQQPPIVTAEGGQPPVGPGGATAFTPGPCQHRHSVPVQTLDGEVAGWLCLNPGCGERLPATWAVLDQDLSP